MWKQKTEEEEPKKRGRKPLPRQEVELDVESEEDEEAEEESEEADIEDEEEEKQPEPILKKMSKAVKEEVSKEQPEVKYIFVDENMVKKLIFDTNVIVGEINRKIDEMMKG